MKLLQIFRARDCVFFIEEVPESADVQGGLCVCTPLYLRVMKFFWHLTGLRLDWRKVRILKRTGYLLPCDRSCTRKYPGSRRAIRHSSVPHVSPVSTSCHVGMLGAIPTGHNFADLSGSLRLLYCNLPTRRTHARQYRDTFSCPRTFMHICRETTRGRIPSHLPRGCTRYRM